MIEQHERSFSWRGASLGYREAGQGELPLLFLHAFPLSSRMWESQLAVFSASQRCLALDFAGFGGSDLPDGPDSSPTSRASRMEDLAAQAVALLDHAEAEKAIVCGLSMGGYAALALAEAAPERLAGLILADTRAGADNEEGRQGRLAMAERVTKEGTGFLPEALVGKLLGKTTKAERPDVVEWVSKEIAAARPEGVAAAQRGMAERPDRLEALAKLSLPTLVLVGEEDELTPPAESRRMASVVSGSTLTLLPTAGHLANLETPEAWNEAVGRFLRGI